MFDKLIVSDEQGAEFKGRSRYFMVSTVVVGVLFVTALVFSLYAADIGLGNTEFELSTMLAPVTPTEPEPPREEPPNQPRQTQANQPESRTHNILRPDEVPIAVPTDISVIPNRFASRPRGDFLLNGIDNIKGIGSPGETGTGPGRVDGTGSETISTEPVAADTIPPPPPVVSKPKPSAPVSKGVINGRATDLPHPRYPEAAKLMAIQGAVNVQVTIDETGKVISAKAIGGHPLLRSEAEKAAWRAKFSTTYLSDVPVKVTGVIIYNFKRS